ncbi:site-specific integrase [Candidatus Bathyarchaeota archaeon]|nr:MAG: site-specific integrase [Candidatus Bathyarchaeota archaeon]
MRKYTRMSVDEDVEEFCGWEFLTRLTNECDNTLYRFLPDKFRKRDKALVATAFLTGGRISEVLMLRRSNFEFQEERIVVKDMALLKRYEKIREYLDVRDEKPEGAFSDLYHYSYKREAWVKRTFDTKPIVKIRKDFPIPYFEPLTPIMVEWVKDANDWLFPTNYLGGKFYCDGVESFAKEFLGVKSRKWITKTLGYSIVREVGQRALEGSELRKKMSRKDFHIWPHWFRSQRASQLGQEYRFKDPHINRFFGWETFRKTQARRYAKTSMEELWELMKPEKVRCERK